MMATTELEKIPETVLSRSQVYEFRTISTKSIADQLRRIVDAEEIQVADESLQLIARDADGSMRDAQSKLDQVIAFTGKTIGAEDVSTVLGLVGRDLLLDAIQAVADEDAPAAFALAGTAVEMGYDLRLVCRELSRVVRDLLVLSVDPSRVTDPEIAGENERERLTALSGRFSREDLLRAFDLLTRAESDIRGAAQPRYHLEMALLRWIYLRKLVPIEDLITGAGAAKTSSSVGSGFSRISQAQPARTSLSSSGSSRSPQESSIGSPQEKASSSPTLSRTAKPAAAREDFKDALLAEIRKSKAVFYNTVVAQAQKIEVSVDRVTFTFSSTQGTLRTMVDQNRAWLESLAQQVSGRKVVVTSTNGGETAAAPAAAATEAPKADRKTALREQAMADAGVQALLDVFPAEIRDVEEM
jgi:DNA polymerase-3 subunit gamma/tau